MTDVTLFRDPTGRPAYYDISDIYDPDNPADNPEDTRIIPEVKSLVYTDQGLKIVTAVDPVTYKSTLTFAYVLVVDEDATKQTSVADYGNNIFRIYVDSRKSPVRLQPHGRLTVSGPASYYTLTTGKGTEDEAVISRRYDTDGNYVGSQIPMLPVLTNSDEPSGIHYPEICHALSDIDDDTEIIMDIYNSNGALIATVRCFAKESSILNETIGYRPQITSIRIEGSQQRENGEFYLYKNQDPDSLNIRAIIVYDDAQEVQVEIDNEKTFLYGLEDFVASWIGLRQNIIFKYYLSADESIDPELGDNVFITAEASVVVVNNEVGSPSVKISAMPRWSVGLSEYTLRYFLYTSDRESVTDVTPNVSITSGTFTGNLYGQYQGLTLSLDLNTVLPDQFPEAVTHTQTLYIKLQPQSALERYLLKDTENAALVYGTDSSSSRRPVLHYDVDLGQYFVPSSIFMTEEAFVSAFYNKATPPFNLDVETDPLAPTHFLLRDPASGVMVIADAIPVEDYAGLIELTGLPALADRFVGTTVLVEFIHEISPEEQLILYGVSVDVYESESGYIE